MDKQKEGQTEAQTSKRIQLPDLQTSVRWFCGGTAERAAWSTPANQLRVFYRSDGTIQWSVYKCTDLSGPKKAGENCAVPETTEFCPKFDGANSSACVFELKKSTSQVNSKTTTVSIEGKLRGEVEKQAGPLTAKGSAEVTGGFSQSYTKAKVVSYDISLSFPQASPSALLLTIPVFLMSIPPPAFVGSVPFLSTFNRKNSSTMGAAQVWKSVTSVCVDGPRTLAAESIQSE